MPGLHRLADTIVQNQHLAFWFLFAFRYLRLVVHIISYLFLYKATPVPSRPSYHAADCTVILPTIDPCNQDFKECLYSILMNSPAAVLIVTVGRANERFCKTEMEKIQLAYPSTHLLVLATEVANKRRQVCAAIPFVTTRFTILADDHVFWSSCNFIPTVLAPFEDPYVGCVGTNKVVRRDVSGFGFRSFFNFLGCVYLERHNFELTSTNAIDGGVFVVSGRTSIIRSNILQEHAFIDGFSNETFFFGKFGPLNADDDNFITRWLVKRNWKIKFQNCEDATVETTLGTYPKFLAQCLRWVRTTWRSNSASLFTDRTVWYSQPWCVYAVYITSFFNFALFYDATLMYTLYYHTSFGNNLNAVCAMAAWIFASKMVKLVPHFLRHPADLIFIPGYIAFAYYHSLIKLYALFTFYVTAWGGRNLTACGTEVEGEPAPENVEVLMDTDPAQFWTPAQQLAGDWSQHICFTEEVGSSSSSTRSSAASSHDTDIGAASSAASASRWVHYSPPLPVSSRVMETPWGVVRRNNLSFQPANVLESQMHKQKLRKRVVEGDAVSVSSSSESSSSSFSSGSLGDSSRISVHVEGLPPVFGPAVPITVERPGRSMAEFCQARQAMQRLEMESRELASAKPARENPTQRSGQASLRVEVKRRWNRGLDCGRQHEGNCNIDGNGRCKIRDVRDVQWRGR